MPYCVFALIKHACTQAAFHRFHLFRLFFPSIMLVVAEEGQEQISQKTEVRTVGSERQHFGALYSTWTFLLALTDEAKTELIESKTEECMELAFMKSSDFKTFSNRYNFSYLKKLYFMSKSLAKPTYYYTCLFRRALTCRIGHFYDCRRTDQSYDLH